MTALVLRGDARHLPLPDNSVHLIVTSPPYWGQRSYTDNGEHYAGQIGSEPTPQEYLEHLWECTAEWARVLTSDGSIFVDLGDKYATRYSSSRGGGRAGLNDDDDTRRRSGQNRTGSPGKSLLLLPERYRIGCVDQLRLVAREVIEWHKPNPTPESATDRCRSTYEDVVHLGHDEPDVEDVVHLTRGPRYFAALDEIREPHSGPEFKGSAGVNSSDWQPDTQAWRSGGKGFVMRHRDYNALGKLPGNVWTIQSQPLVVPAWLGEKHHAAFPMELPRRIIMGWSPSGICLECGQGRWPVSSSVRTFDGQPREDLAAWADSDAPRRTPNGGASHSRYSTDRRHLGYACACTPYTDHPGTGEPTGRREYSPGVRDDHAQGTYHRDNGPYERVGPWREYHLADWTPPPTRPAIVVDPFGGTGTTATVADVLGRTGITFDRSASYCQIARWRTRDPAERAKALEVPKPPPVSDGQGSLFDDLGVL
jgi:site-specific DNA-methyltransferase (adenine-specific)